MRRTLAAILLCLISASAFAQSAPYVYDLTVGTSSVPVLAASQSRRRAMFINPNTTATVAVCPTISRRTGSALTCTVGGPGSVTLLPSAAFQVEAISGGNLPTAWNGIASAGGSSLTILEWE